MFQEPPLYLTNVHLPPAFSHEGMGGLMLEVGVRPGWCPLEDLADVEAKGVEFLRELLHQMLKRLQFLRERIVAAAVKDLVQELQSCKNLCSQKVTSHLANALGQAMSGDSGVMRII